MSEFNVLNRSLPNVNAAGAVSLAAQIATDFSIRSGGQRVAAQSAGIDREAFKRLTQPSRQPKSIGVDIWNKFINGYTRHLRRELVGIETEIRRLDALGSPLRPLEDLLDEMDAVSDRIRHIIEKRG